MLPLFQQLYRLRLTITALLLAAVGIALMSVGRRVSESGTLGWLPLSDLGSTLVVAGLVGTLIDFLTTSARNKQDDARLRRLLAESAPAFRDAVVRGFAVDSEDLRRIATPELLDSLATNALSLRLGDRRFAEEVYADIRDQAIRAPERWMDVAVALRLSPAPDHPDRFIVTARWEYTVVPSHAVQRFACVSDREDYLDAISDVPATIAWFMTPRSGFDATSSDAFELVELTVDGEPRTVRRSGRKSGQTYSATIGREVVEQGRPVRLSYTYRTITPRYGHRLYIDIEQPTRGIRVELDYSDCDIAEMSILDLVAANRPITLLKRPSGLPGKTIGAEFDGWVFPRTGFAFVWSLSGEIAPTTSSDRAS